MTLNGEQLLAIHRELSDLELRSSSGNVVKYESGTVPKVLIDFLGATVQEVSSNFGKYYIITIDYNKIK